MRIGVMHDPRLRWLNAPSATVERESGQVIVWADSLQQWGIGQTFSEAADDFARAVAHEYFWLTAIPDARLSSHLQKLKRTYKRYLGTRT